MNDVAAPRRFLRREERQASILAAAARAFARAGFAATSMEDVAAEAGVTRLILYRHFESKEDLYRSVLTRVSDRLEQEFIGLLKRPERRQRGFITRSILTVAREDPDSFRLLMVHAHREPNFAEYASQRHQQALVIADAMIADAIADPVMKRWASQTIVNYLIHGVLVWLDEGDPQRDEEFVSFATDGLVAMFSAWAPTRAKELQSRLERAGRGRAHE
ncbi:MAG: TetR/AcrR family transcriptional regulator [Acidimicrobiales bacterium]|nr:TetR/AcrR family transcriptional regulator [Acidimicrobiales bacterium]